ncbi:hypothetical protein CO180_03120 [candidate division WWE3 bacterium CG_4_9_14_3_um_filter_41_6]|nr:MAG: hypothetical protein CO180_03120 [candidate division WWE3 bacterium CG_4_9_14_3_um_filter_41_6]
MTNSKLQTTIQKITTSATAITLAGFVCSLFTLPVFAEQPVCYGQYGVQIECPIVQTTVSVDKLVRKANTSNPFVESVNLQVGNLAEFAITVTNTGESTLNEVKLIDILPSNLVTTGATQFTLNNFAPGEKRTFTLVATVKTIDDSTQNTSCTVNVANVVYRGEKMSSDTAQVCVTTGTVLAAKLPATAMTGTSRNIATATVGMFLIVFLSGAVIVSSTHIVEQARNR